MVDINSLTPSDIQRWFDQATPNQARQVLTPVLEKVRDYPQQDRDQLIQQMSSRTRKLFESQPVG